MNWFEFLLWALAGSALALLFLIMQRWTVKKVHPDKVKGSKRLVIGGAVLRWILFSLLAMLALVYSYAATFIVFFAFMGTRMFLLFVINKRSFFESRTTT